MGILGKIMIYIMGYNWQYFEIIDILSNNLFKILEYIRQKLWDIFANTMGIFGKDFSLYWAKTIGYFMGYIR